MFTITFRKNSHYICFFCAKRTLLLDWWYIRQVINQEMSFDGDLLISFLIADIETCWVDLFTEDLWPTRVECTGLVVFPQLNLLMLYNSKIGLYIRSQSDILTGHEIEKDLAITNRSKHFPAFIRPPNNIHRISFRKYILTLYLAAIIYGYTRKFVWMNSMHSSLLVRCQLLGCLAQVAWLFTKWVLSEEHKYI